MLLGEKASTNSTAEWVSPPPAGCPPVTMTLQGLAEHTVGQLSQSKPAKASKRIYQTTDSLVNLLHNYYSRYASTCFGINNKQPDCETFQNINIIICSNVVTLVFDKQQIINYKTVYAGVLPACVCWSLYCVSVHSYRLHGNVCSCQALPWSWAFPEESTSGTLWSPSWLLMPHMMAAGRPEKRSLKLRRKNPRDVKFSKRSSEY